MTEYNIKKVNDFAEVTDYVANGSFASLKENVEYKDTPDYAILIRLKDYKSGWNGDYVYVPEYSYRFLKKSYLNPGDVVISNVGAYAGTVFLVPNLGKPMTLGPNAIVVRPFKSKRKYLFYFFKSQFGQGILKSIIGGSAQPKFNKTDFRNLEIPLPPFPIQTKIALTLSAFDDSIENNIRRIQILEEMASRVYREWFVHFRFPGHENVKMVESELGMIPEGWKVKRLGELTSVITKGTTPTTLGKSFQDEGINFFKVESIDANGGIVDSKLAKIDHETHELLRRSQIYEGDILFSIAGAIGRSTLVPKRVLPANTNQALAIIRPCDSFFTNYLYQNIRSADFLIFSLGRVVQTAQANVSLSVLSSAPILVPNEHILARFNDLISSNLGMIEILYQKNINLRQTRGLLLPKLISGKIDVSELDIDIGAVAA